MTLAACAGTALDRALPEQQQEAGAFPASDFAAACEPWDDWDKPAPPFQVFGNTYHVGTCGITSILVTSAQGHLIIDSGTKAGAEVVAANVQALGFSLSDVRYLTHTQEHFDHVGGMARLQELTGARLIASKRAQPVFETGISQAGDPQHGMHEPMAPVKVDRVIENGAAIELDGQSIHATYTPGHSPGAISWRWIACESERCLTLIVTDGLSPVAAPDYRWADHPQYLRDYQASIEWLMGVDVDLCLSAHPSQTRLFERIEADALVDSSLCRSAAVGVLNRLTGVLAAQLDSDSISLIHIPPEARGGLMARAALHREVLSPAGSGASGQLTGDGQR
jgi:metallo-beta-lactamase class B